MNAASLQEIKKELQQLSREEVADLCLSLARYKKDNKELLGCLLFDAHDKPQFVAGVKEEIDEYIEEVKPQKNLYLVKKSLRKVLRVLTKYSKYVADKNLIAEIYIHFCHTMKNSGIPYHNNTMLVNLYNQQLKKIQALVETLHEDLQSDFAKEIEELKEQTGTKKKWFGL